MGLLAKTFTWWKEASWGTALFTRRKGVRVGTDDQGNVYYRERNGERRWVIYNGDIEASRVPPEWHAWLHYTVDAPPSEKPPLVKAWEKQHVANQTGSLGAYFPAGSLNARASRPKATGDYEAWRPE